MSSTKPKAAETQQVIDGDEAEQTDKQEQECQRLENAMPIDSRRRTRKKKVEEDCETMGDCCYNPELPTHIVIDILLRVPAKTLLNFRRVCKEWLSLISDPHFANLHLSKSQSFLLVKPIFRDQIHMSCIVNLVDLPVNPSTPHNDVTELVTKINLPKCPNIPYNIINSCNGLLCLCESRSFGPIFICNPLLGELVTLPKSPSGHLISNLSEAAFGYSPINDQYKVVRSFNSRVIDPLTGLQMSEVEIYTLGGGSWRKIGEIPTMVDNSSFDAFLNGSLHWLPPGYSLDCICCFDFGSEQFRAVPEPSEFDPVQKRRSHSMHVGVLRGCLSICNYGRPDLTELWTMKDYGVKESWSKYFVISMKFCRFGIFTEPIRILEDGQILIFDRHTGSILLYESGSKRPRNVHSFLETHFIGLTHVPGLLSLRNVAKGENFKKLSCLKETGKKNVQKLSCLKETGSSS